VRKVSAVPKKYVNYPRSVLKLEGRDDVSEEGKELARNKNLGGEGLMESRRGDRSLDEQLRELGKKGAKRGHSKTKIKKGKESRIERKLRLSSDLFFVRKCWKSQGEGWPSLKDTRG